MIRALSARERLMVSIGASIVALLLLLGRGLPSYLNWRARVFEDAAQVARALEDTKHSLAETPVVQDSLELRTRRLLDVAPSLVPGTSPALAASALAATVAKAAVSSNVRVGSTRLSYDTAGAGAFTHVSVRVDATGDITGLTQFLLQIERGPLLLAVRELSVSQPEAAGPETQPETLRAEFVVEGLTTNGVERSR